MEFLAESIGLLDMDSNVTTTTSSGQPTTNNTNNYYTGWGGHIARSLLFYQEVLSELNDAAAADTDEDDDGGGGDEEARPPNDQQSTVDTENCTESTNIDDGDCQQEVIKQSQSLSPLSSLIPPLAAFSPLSPSSDSSSSTMNKSYGSLSSSDAVVGKMSPLRKQFIENDSNDGKLLPMINYDNNYTAANKKSSKAAVEAAFSTTDSNVQLSSSSPIPLQPNTTSSTSIPTNNNANYTTTIPATNATTTSSFSPPENLLTKHVTQRIDARTNYHCFTGNIDAITGHLLHGTMLHRFTGEVYEGPFITTNTYHNNNHNSSSSSSSNNSTTYCNSHEKDNYSQNDNGDYGTMTCIRHGMGATCQYSNGMKFVGSYEWDYPKKGTYISGGEWTYEGPLIRAVEEDSAGGVGGRRRRRMDANFHGAMGNNNINNTGGSGGGGGSGTIATFTDMGTFGIGKASSNKVIGTTHPLPGSVVFEGTGRFLRSDGLVYQGEFTNGLAHGVGKEILPHGEGVYYGEFAFGLRHGVGTLMEDVVCEEDDSSIDESEWEWEEEEEECGCTCRESECRIGESQGVCAEEQSQLVMGDENDDANIIISSPAGSSINKEQSGMNNGPDFAAGGEPPSSILNTCAAIIPSDVASSSEGKVAQMSESGISSTSPIGATTENAPSVPISSNSFQTPSKVVHQCHKKCVHRRRKPKTRNQRYSSGVWCAGQFEIEDSHGTVYPGKNEDDSDKGLDSDADNGNVEELNEEENNKDDSDGNRSGLYSRSSSSSLNRTTWDLLPEKWLGLGD